MLDMQSFNVNRSPFNVHRSTFIVYPITEFVPCRGGSAYPPETCLLLGQIRRSAPTASNPHRSTFIVQRSTFIVNPISPPSEGQGGGSPFIPHRSPFIVNRSTFNVQRFFVKKSAHLHWRCNILFLSAFTVVQMVFRGVQILSFLYSNHLFFFLSQHDCLASLFYQIQGATTSAAAK